MNPLIEKGLIPPDKSWMIRLGVLDLLSGYDDSIMFLEKNYTQRSDDLQSMYHASIGWKEGREKVCAGESATLYRFLRFSSWKLGKKLEIEKTGTLVDRPMCDNPEIVTWPLERLLTLDGGTSQWASAAVIMGNTEKVEKIPFKLQVTYNAVSHWKTARDQNKPWKERYDETLLKQAEAYTQWLKTGKMRFKPEQAEDYCFARAFGLISAEEGEKIWPGLRGHESDRIKEMEKALSEEVVSSKDHRVVQAVAMAKGEKARIAYPFSVNKSWPQFWQFLDYCSEA
jgi:hypothetical protein